ncbi:MULTISPECIES: hypothetical protein [Streptomyces]|uniref:Uncharacterized protein n=1 Tax=Streptomyces tendae TaxID=1932 RepID=A0ABW7RZF8_STRTE|nr:MULTISPECIES: hypothetical protein [unclassified Streptomyces]MCW1095284.1 hypothetical protein [Streptomyces sp. RS2]BET48868.1 hypothetical protein RGQ21_38500 [Kitasatospora aureofaciens]
MKKYAVELAPEFEAELWEVCIALIRCVVVAGLSVDSARSAFREKFSGIGARAGLSSAEIDLVCYGFKCWLLTHKDECARRWTQ